MNDFNSVYYQKTTFKIAVLSLSLLTIMSGAGVAPGISKIAAAFPDVSETLIKLIISLPPLFMIISALLSGILERYVNHKALISLGLILFIAGGVGAGYMQTIPLILMFRALLGFGTGIILPFSTGLIAACFKGVEKSKLIGLSSASNCLGAIFGNIVAGILAVIDWKYMFHIYWIGGIVLVLILLYLNHLPENRKKIISKEKLPKHVFLYSFFAFLTMMLFFLIVTNLSFIVHQRHLGASSVTGLLFAVNSLSMLVSGILLPYGLKLKKYFIPFVLLLISAGLLSILAANQIFYMFFAIALFGLGLGLLFPYLLNLTSEKVPNMLAVKAMSIGMACAWFGQFISPLFFGLIMKKSGMQISQLLIVLSIIVLIVSFFWFLRIVVDPVKTEKGK